MSDPALLHRTIPTEARSVIDGMAGKLGVSGPTLSSAILAWEALSGLTPTEQRKALAVLVGLMQRPQGPTTR